MVISPKNLRLLSYSEEPFSDRQEAGRLLAEALKDFYGKDTVVLGIPRGGMVIAYEISRALNSELDIVLSRKIGAPGNPELAIGAVSEDGQMFLNEDLLIRIGVNMAYAEKAKAHQLVEIKNRISLFRQYKEKVSLSGKIIIVTDDGVATGATMQAALWTIRRENPQRLIAAIPVGAEESLRALADYADEVVALRAPPDLSSIGQFYRHFEQTSDEEVATILQEAGKINERSDER